MEDINVPFVEVHYVSIQKLGEIPVIKGDFQSLPPNVQKWVAQMVRREKTQRCPYSNFEFLFKGTIVYSSWCIYL